MKIKELIFEDRENLDKKRFSGPRNLQEHKKDLLREEIPGNLNKEISCVNEVGIDSLEKEAACLQQLGVESYEIDYIITLRFRENNIN